MNLQQAQATIQALLGRHASSVQAGITTNPYLAPSSPFNINVVRAEMERRQRAQAFAPPTWEQVQSILDQQRGIPVQSGPLPVESAPPAPAPQPVGISPAKTMQVQPVPSANLDKGGGLFEPPLMDGPGSVYWTPIMPHPPPPPVTTPRGTPLSHATIARLGGLSQTDPRYNARFDPWRPGGLDPNLTEEEVQGYLAAWGPAASVPAGPPATYQNTMLYNMGYAPRPVGTDYSAISNAAVSMLHPNTPITQAAYPGGIPYGTPHTTPSSIYGTPSAGFGAPSGSSGSPGLGTSTSGVYSPPPVTDHLKPWVLGQNSSFEP